jgi:hypothetical protein
VGLLEVFSPGLMGKSPVNRTRIDLEASWETEKGFETKAKLRTLTERGAILSFVWLIQFRHIIGDIFFFPNNIAVYSQLFPKDGQDVSAIKILHIAKLDDNACHLVIRQGGTLVRSDIKGGNKLEASVTPIHESDTDDFRIFGRWMDYRDRNQTALSAFYSRELRRMGLSQVLR